MKPIIKYCGGKSKLVKEFLPLIPEHKTYVEAFCGSGALLFAKESSDIEIINDLNSGLFTLYRVLQNTKKFNTFQRLANITPYSRQMFSFCKDTWNSCEDEVEKAYRWFIMMRFSYRAVGRAFGCSKTSGKNGGSDVSGFLKAVERLPEIHHRLRTVTVENSDFRKVIPAYDTPNTFFYLDPPYGMAERNGKSKMYQHEMTDNDHRELVQLLSNIQGKVMLSGYANPMYVALEKNGWKRQDFAHSTAIPIGKNITAEQMKRTESIWMNY